MDAVAPRDPATTTVQSYSYTIRNIFHDALQGDPFFAGFTVRKTTMLPIKTELLPYLGVYIADETMTPDGDANQTTIKFSHTLRIGFSAIVAHSDQDDAEQEIDQIFWHIMNRLWCDPNIMNILDATNPKVGNNPDNVRIESLVRGIRRHRFGTTGHNNETPIAELQYDVSVFYRTMWWPDITDTLDTIDVKTGVKPGDTQAEMDKRLQEHVTYDLTGGPSPTPPSVTGVAPDAGPIAGGTNITISGSGFTNTTAIRIGPASVGTFMIVNDNTITTSTPPGAAVGVVDVRVTNTIGTSQINPADQFTYS